jgi:hypothetical protein
MMLLLWTVKREDVATIYYGLLSGFTPSPPLFAIVLALSSPSSACSHGSVRTARSAVNATNVTGADLAHVVGLCDSTNPSWGYVTA